MTEKKVKTQPKVKVEAIMDDQAKPTTIEQKIETLQQENSHLADQAARALADYQNLVRRQQEDQAKMVEFCRVGIFEDLLKPLEHLSLAAANLKNEGLDMVIKQLWQTLEKQGLQEYRPQGEQFNPETMEVMTKAGDGETVLEVLSPGYKLNGHIIQVARVKVG